MRKPYRSDLTEPQWQLIQPLLPAAKPGGRPRTVDLREVVNTLFYQARTGCQWDYLPHDLAPKGTVWDYFVRWHQDGTWQKIVDALRTRISVERLLRILLPAALETKLLPLQRESCSGEERSNQPRLLPQATNSEVKFQMQLFHVPTRK